MKLGGKAHEVLHILSFEGTLGPAELSEMKHSDRLRILDRYVEPARVVRLDLESRADDCEKVPVSADTKLQRPDPPCFPEPNTARPGWGGLWRGRRNDLPVKALNAPLKRSVGVPPNTRT